MTTTPAQQPPASRALALTGSFDDASKINERLRDAAERFFLVSPATSCPRLAPGCVVSTSIVAINPETETHDVGGKRALLKTALLRLANAAGIAWRPGASGRVDDGRHPYVCHWHAEGVWRGLDGTWLPVVGDCQMDLRDGSAQTTKVLESARAKTNSDGSIRVSAAEVGRVQLRDMRAKILEHAQSKAQLRGIRSALAIRSYTAAELAAKPFVVAKLCWVGSDSADDRAAIRESFLRASNALFGQASPLNLPAPAPARAALVASTITTDGEIVDDFEEPFASEPPGADGPAEPTGEAPAPGPTATPPTAAAAPATEAPGRSGHVIPGGHSKGVAVEDAADRDLSYWIDRLDRSLADGTSRSKERDTALVKAMSAELTRRQEATS